MGFQAAPGSRVVWIVDDSPTEAEMARRALADQHHVELYADGTSLIEELSSRSAPAVLVLDWLMPGMTGIEVLEFLRSKESTEKLPVLLLTAQQQTQQIVEGLAAGANDFLGKPYAPAELRARVAALLRSQALLERAEQAERRLRKVLSQLPDAVVTIDSQRRLVYTNRQSELLLGITAAQAIGRPLADVVPGLKLDQAAEFNGILTLPDIHLGERVLAPRISIPPSDDEGNTTLALRDVTEARTADAHRIDFYSMVAHDMRSPLSALQMRGAMLLRGRYGPLAPAVKEELEKMNTRATELVALINDFLSLAEMENDRFRLAPEKVDLIELARDSIDVVQPLADAKHVRLLASACASPSLVEADRRRINQVLANLLANAIKFTPPEGEVQIRVEEDGGQLKMSVRDTGIGIAQSALPGLFQKYVRVAGGSSKVEGTGLGLAIVREVVQAHGGTVGVESKVGAGSTFWFRLPKAPVDSQPAEASR